jgi:hypothetical protein
MHDMIKRFYGWCGPRKFKPFNGIHSSQKQESIIARIVGHSETIARRQLDEQSAIRFLVPSPSGGVQARERNGRYSAR